MEYSAAVTYVESLGKFGIHLGMERIQGLTALLDHPERKIRTIHVTGTNGKGSVTTFLANMLQQAGKKVGSYTSPHFVRYNERICLNGEEISNEDFAAVTERTKAALDRFLAEGGEQPTQFEFITAMAFLYFAEKQVDYAVIEVGMGGLWDSTNIITPEVSVITNVTLEHTDRLGEDHRSHCRPESRDHQTGGPGGDGSGRQGPGSDPGHGGSQPRTPVCVRG